VKKLAKEIEESCAVPTKKLRKPKINSTNPR